MRRLKWGQACTSISHAGKRRSPIATGSPALNLLRALGNELPESFVEAEVHALEHVTHTLSRPGKLPQERTMNQAPRVPACLQEVLHLIELAVELGEMGAELLSLICRK